MFGQLLAIARNTFTESVRQPIFFALIVLSGILQFFNTMLSAYTMELTTQTEVVKDDKLLFDLGLATVLLCCTLLAAFTATSVLSREIENKTALTVISKPIGRPLFVLGKYLGVAAAILIAGIVMLTFFHFAIRHGVLQTARDEVDLPVIAIGVGSAILAIGIAAWANFFYGWVFPSTASLLMLGLCVPAYVVLLTLSPDWEWQSPAADFKPQIMIASVSVLLAMMVLTAVAIAASTRLGQVMTIVISASVFLGGLVSNYFIGRFAYENEYLAIIESVDDVPVGETGLAFGGESLTVTLDQIPTGDLGVGDSFYYGPSPQGINLAVPRHPRFTGDPTDIAQLQGPEATPGLIVQDYDLEAKRWTIVRSGAIPIGRLPRDGDYVFNRPTEVNIAALAGWSIVPNLQPFWLVDAITQGHTIPARYVGLVFGYAFVQITGLLALAVILFQRREVG
ncbi:MAG: hypothetical protein Tsb0013_09380 [Phycisphaerales bacterium]